MSLDVKPSIENKDSNRNAQPRRVRRYLADDDMLSADVKVMK